MTEDATPNADRLIEEMMALGRLMRAAAFPAYHVGITPEQSWLLRFLERESPISVGALAEALGITPSSATSACKRLEQAGLVTRTRLTTDERVVQVALTDRGHAQLIKQRRKQREAMRRLLAVLDTHEQDTLHRLLARVVAAGGGCPHGHGHGRGHEYMAADEQGTPMPAASERGGPIGAVPRGTVQEHAGV